MKVLNNKGVIHIAAIIAVAAIALLWVNYQKESNNTHGGQTTSAYAQADKESAEFVRQTAYTMIDLHGKLLKMQVDTALSTWNSLTPDQKRQAWDYLQRGIQSSMSELDRIKPQLAQQGG